MSDYKNSLNLPSTNFPMRGNLPNKEPKTLKNWQQQALYKTLRETSASKPKFILHDGPPYANGPIHIGHAVNKIIKDIIVKSKQLSGFDAPFIPGWDCHGLPIELNVEKKKGKVGQKINAKDFRLACREYADKQIEAQKEDFKRLGIIANWDEPYLTKAYQYEANIVRALGEIIDNGHLTQGAKPVHWCCDCASALAEAEVEYQDKQSPAVYVKFEFNDNAIFFVDKPVSVVIWTTTPWTLPANEAVALHPDLNYILLEGKDEYLLVAESLAQNIIALDGLELSVFAQMEWLGKSLEGQLVKHPFYDKQVPIILGDYVSDEAGTGCVHTAPSHGQEDYVVGLKYDLPIQSLVNNRGVFFEDVDLVAGQFVFKANAVVVEALLENNTLLSHTQIKHSYPHCWRHKSPVIFRATPQWFISMDAKNLKSGLRNKALAEIKSVDWLPDWGQRRIELMIENRPDWCVSRQRSWGTPIALFVHKQTKELHPNTKNLIEIIAKRIENSGIDAWFELEAQELLGDEAHEYEKITDTLDVWFDSGVSHFAVLKSRAELQTNDHKADLYLEGSDQHRGWFQSSLLSSVAINGCAPYKQVLTHGFTVDEKGKKMSKSLGNVISPQKVVNEFGADILRLWVASSDYTNEMTVSNAILKNTSDGYRRIRNTLRFMLANMTEFCPNDNLVKFEDMLDLDRWIVAKTAQLQQNMIGYYNQYNFHLVCKDLISFCSNDLGGFYLDIIKDRQYTTQQNSLARRSAQTALYHITQTLTRLISPILSFTAQEVWDELPKVSHHKGNKNNQTPLFSQEWYQNLEKDFTHTAIDKARVIAGFVQGEIEKLRATKTVGSSLEVCVVLYCDEALLATLSSFEDELRFLFITASATLKPLSEADKTAVEIEQGLLISVQKSIDEKCIRCWHHHDTVGKNTSYKELCTRCVDNVYGDGEVRKFA